MQSRQRRVTCPLCGCSDAAVEMEVGIGTDQSGHPLKWAIHSRRCDHLCSLTQHGTCGKRSGTPADLDRGELRPPVV